MPYNGTGAYTVPSGTALVAGEGIFADEYNIFLADLQRAVSQTKNRGLADSMQGTLKMGGFKIASNAAASAAYDLLTHGKIYPSITGVKILSPGLTTLPVTATMQLAGTNSNIIIITGTGTVDVFSTTLPDRAGPYYILCRSAGVIFSLAGNIRYMVNSPQRQIETYLPNMLFIAWPSATLGFFIIYPMQNKNTLVAGQEVVTAAGTSTWTVPPGVYKVSVLAISGGGTAVTNVLRSAVLQVAANYTGSFGDGVFYGGLPGAVGFNGGGGGGAAGYTGDGGVGGAGGTTAFDSGAGTSIAGGGGGGGGGGAAGLAGGFGGGVKLEGVAASGAGGAAGTTQAGASGSNLGVGFAYGSGPPGQQGGCLAWKNTIACTPGEVFTIQNGTTTFASVNYPGAVRFMWGSGRSFPSNALFA